MKKFNTVSCKFLVTTCFVSLLTLGMSGCSEAPETPTKTMADAKHDNHQKTLKQYLKERESDVSQANLSSGLEKLYAGDYDGASALFNASLYENSKNPLGHYLNALVYHIKAQKGDQSQYAVAETGYLNALKYNPNLPQAYVQLGRVYMAQERFRAAQDMFASALLIDNENQDALYELASASYFSGDVSHAEAAINQFLKKYPDKAMGYRAAAMIYAAIGNGAKTQENFDRYRELATNPSQVAGVEKRINDFQALHAKGKIILAQAQDSATVSDVTGQPSPEPAAPAAGAEAAAAPAAAPAAGEKKPGEEEESMVVVDAMVLRVSEEGHSVKGNNIMEKFNLNVAPGTFLRGRGVASFDGKFDGVKPADNTFANTFSLDAAAAGTGGTISNAWMFSQGLSFGNVAYSLNIANVNRSRIEIIGRPSLVASTGKKASFFSGTELVLGLTGQFGGTITKTPVGVTLEITINSINKSEVVLDVSLYGSILAVDALQDVDDASKKFTKIGLSRVQTSVKVNLGETIMIGGILEGVHQFKKTGFPILQDIPIVQYFFSQESIDNTHKSVMYLLTPRRYKDTVRDIKNNINEAEKRHNLTELEERNKDWYDPRGNMILILKRMTPLYREFRFGDIASMEWDYIKGSIDDQLNSLVSFLYY